MQKVAREFRSFEEAAEADRDFYCSLSGNHEWICFWNGSGNTRVMKLSKDSREFIALLNSHAVEYLVVGACAKSLRATRGGRAGRELMTRYRDTVYPKWSLRRS